MSKIEPVYVTFEQAKKLKEKSFDVNVESCSYGHSKNENWVYKVHPEFPGWKGRIREAYFENEEPLLIPEHWQVVEWLRLNHGIWIFSDYGKKNNNWYNNIQLLPTQTKHVERILWQDGFNSPKEATLAAIDYVLKNLI